MADKGCICWTLPRFLWDIRCLIFQHDHKYLKYLNYWWYSCWIYVDDVHDDIFLILTINMVVEDLVEDVLECFWGGHVYHVWIQIWTRNHPIRSTQLRQLQNAWAQGVIAKRASGRSSSMHTLQIRSWLWSSLISMITEKWHEMAHVKSCYVMFVRKSGNDINQDKSRIRMAWLVRHKTAVKSSFFMGKSTISTGPCSIAING